MFLCRFCAKEQPQQKIIDLKTDQIHRHSVLEKLSIFSDGFVDFSVTNLPETVCTECYTTLITSYEFIVQVLESQTILKKFFDNVDIVDEVFSELDKNEFSPSRDSSESDEDPIAVTNTVNNLDNIILEESLTEESWSTYPWHCGHCDITLSSLQEVREHSQEAHNTCYGFRCADCDEKMGSFDEFVDHVVKERRELANYCEYCNIKIEIASHRNAHVAENICTYCGQLFTNEPSLFAHLRNYVTKNTGFLTFDMGICEETIYRSDECDSETETNPDELGIVCSKQTTGILDDPKFQIENNTDSIAEATLHLNDTTSPTNNIVCVSDKDTKIKLWSQYPRVCKFCNVKVAYSDMLKEHCMFTHKRCFGMKCVDCNYDGANTLEEFVQHVRGHRPYLMDICYYCDSKTLDYEFHVQTHISKLQCKVCGESFPRFRDLRKHDNQLDTPVLKPLKKRSKIPLTDEEVTCDVCGKIVKKMSLKTHKTLHTDRQKNHTCDRCGKTFYSKHDLLAHYKMHEVTKETCKICNLSFQSGVRLKSHVRTHYPKLSFQCDHCKKFFKRKSFLVKHMVVHMNVKPYVCEYCQKGFKHKNNLKNHVHQHTGARPYNCEICPKSFACWSNCNKHMKRIHGVPLAKKVRTALGTLPIDLETGKPIEITITNEAEEWSKQILEKRDKVMKKKKTKTQNNQK